MGLSIWVTNPVPVFSYLRRIWPIEALFALILIFVVPLAVNAFEAAWV
jgi:hypothetical protein